tara:strand:- start:48 stop:341 length:294 start_codon:yes stop_codon:yes gene_type:complete
VELIYFILASFGITQIIVYGKIFEKARPTQGWLGELFRCSMCVGFWAGLIMYGISFYTELFNFDKGFATGFVLGCLSSGTSYVLSTLFDDEGIRGFK